MSLDLFHIPFRRKKTLKYSPSKDNLLENNALASF